MRVIVKRDFKELNSSQLWPLAGTDSPESQLTKMDTA